MWQGQRSRTVVIGVAFAALFVCCVLPIVYLLGTTLATHGDAYGALVLDRRQRGLLYNTAFLGVGTALLATAIGAPLGVALARVPLRRKAVIRVIAAVPILLPPYIVALAWIYLGGSRGLLAALSGRDLFSAWTYPRQLSFSAWCSIHSRCSPPSWRCGASTAGWRRRP
jgi:iron(III) transport system permease protein